MVIQKVMVCKNALNKEQDTQEDLHLELSKALVNILGKREVANMMESLVMDLCMINLEGLRPKEGSNTMESSSMEKEKD